MSSWIKVVGLCAFVAADHGADGTVHPGQSIVCSVDLNGCDLSGRACPRLVAMRGRDRQDPRFPRVNGLRG
jgi:hypothetical protein